MLAAFFPCSSTRGRAKECFPAACTKQSHLHGAFPARGRAGVGSGTPGVQEDRQSTTDGSCHIPRMGNSLSLQPPFLQHKGSTDSMQCLPGAEFGGFHTPRRGHSALCHWISGPQVRASLGTRWDPGMWGSAVVTADSTSSPGDPEVYCNGKKTGSSASMVFLLHFMLGTQPSLYAPSS